MQPTKHLLRVLPAVDKLINHAVCQPLIERWGREQVLNVLRLVLEETRRQILAGHTASINDDALLAQAARHLHDRFTPSLRPVINATGVIIHTNLGRAPLSEAAQRALTDIAAQYNTLEYDLSSGERGSRLIHAEALLTELTGAQAALIVNNNAAALVLLLSALAQDREVIISRGQLVEIGGGFRVPEVMRQSGAKLVEVGTTNRTRPEDYQQAITPNTALLLRAHTSNFKQIGFVEAVPLAEMAHIAHTHQVYLVDDLGSGALLDTALYGLEHEPTISESIAAGCDLVAFSGDKLLGGPQAGILLGRSDLIDRLKQHPLARAVRADKLCLAALTATLDHYRKGEAVAKIPVWRMIARTLEDLHQTAHTWAADLGGQVVDGESTVGGGSLPGAVLPTALLALDTPNPAVFAARLRSSAVPVIARIAGGRILFDPRTVLPGQEIALVTTVRQVLAR